jgi:hypothetical protein
MSEHGAGKDEYRSPVNRAFWISQAMGWRQKLIEKQTAKERLEGVTVERRTALLTVLAVAFRGLFAQWQPARRQDGMLLR